MSNKRTLQGVAAAALGAGVVLTALLGVEIGAMASTDPASKSQTCAEAIHAWEQAEADAKKENSYGERRDGKVITDAEKNKIKEAEAAAKDPDGPGTNKKGEHDGTVVTPDEQATIDAAYAAATDPNGPGLVHDGTVVTAEEQNQINNRKTAADKACQGTPGTPGRDGKPGADGKDGAPGQVIVRDVIREAPAPQVQQLNGTGVIVTH